MILDLKIDLELLKNSLIIFNLSNESLIGNMFKSEGEGGQCEIDHVVILVITCTEICH